MSNADVEAEYDAIVVGSGPNGLTAAATLATHGKTVLVVEASDTIGGAVRSTDHGAEGWIHDTGATVHALASSSPAFGDLGLCDHGVEYAHPEVLLAHPLPKGEGAALYRSIDETADGLGRDGGRYRRFIGHTARRFDSLADDVLGPLISIPRHTLTLARFGVRAALPMSVIAKWFRTEQARALIGGSAAHSFTPLHHPLTTSFALMLHGAGHHGGWPFARGGSQTIADGLAKIIEQNGGEIVTATRVGAVSDLPPHKVLLLDTAPRAVASILGDELPPTRRKRFGRFRHGPGVYKVDFNLSGPIPWQYEPATRAGTVHVVGTYDELASAERATAAGEMPERPFVLIGQASLVDDSRAPAGFHSCWSYAHVPNGSTADAEPLIVEQIERFAPGFSQLIVDSTASSPASLERTNANLVGGDLGGGSYSGLQLLRRPTLSPHPYRTGADGVYICSASTPPGGGAHGMSGRHAALDALSRELAD